MRDINLFEGIKKSAPQKKTSRAVSTGLIILILSAVALGGIYGWLRYTETNLDKQIASLNQEISGKSDEFESSGETGVKQKKLMGWQTYNNALAALTDNVKTYPKLDLALLNDIAKRMPSDVTVQNLAYQNGVLSLDCLANNVDSPAAFVYSIKESAYIDTVNYKGSTIYIAEGQSPADAIAAGQYQFTVDCYLKGGSDQ